MFYIVQMLAWPWQETVSNQRFTCGTGTFHKVRPLLNGILCLALLSGDGPDGGSAAPCHRRVFPRHSSAPSRRCAGIHSAPAVGTRQGLSGQVPEWPGDLQVLCGAAGETGEAAARGGCLSSLSAFNLYFFIVFFSHTLYTT